mmetsp:Transcript_87625/g.256183  ORF Transcript_87625/g.256183 Transcript_87625/m.256183 type:complete len:261 (-) Transcript_87625:1802-2584(-)
MVSTQSFETGWTVLPWMPSKTAVGPKGVEPAPARPIPAFVPRRVQRASSGSRGAAVALTPSFGTHAPGVSGSGLELASHTIASPSLVAQMSFESSFSNARSRTLAGQCLHGFPPSSGERRCHLHCSKWRMRFAGSRLSGRLSTKSSGEVARSTPCLSSWRTWNSMTWPVVLASAITKSSVKPPKGSSGPVLVIRTTVPRASFRKSTSTSARSAGPSSSASRGDAVGRCFFGRVPLPGRRVLKPVLTRTTLGRRLWSPPIW